MSAAARQPSSYLDSRESIGSRAVSLLFALLITALIVALLIGLGALPMGRPPSQPAIVMMDLPGAGSEPTPRKVAKPSHADRGGPKASPTPARTTSAPPPTPRPPTPVPWNVIPMSSSDFASSDIANAPSHKGERMAAADGGGGSDSGAGSGSGSGGGGAPGGDELLAVDWYRKPTDAELQPYMPRVMPANGGWGEIACRMIADYRVEDCREIGETPGSGFSRMMRQAAWQFRVLPPRRNGRQVLGSWVRIHYDFTRRDASASDPG